ncbi:putative colanic acid biosynthesis acetyltransferase [Paludibaculum fermentans]|uniref:Putative colanic acid biosynthesis acetyltransferase n=2 Tax=Paludibaculum fermentans TaxID=1473598 RepID=A0A7S7SPY8_PALFE|nr:putative colanic acid biosynthesis acetyltransferase [Paludibaculum fermentans]
MERTAGKDPFPSPHGLRNKVMRAVWGVAWHLLVRPTPKILHGWRRFVLCCFGAKLGPGVHVYPTAKVWAPWLLEMGPHACLGPSVDCYNVGGIRIGAYATVSQYSYLCGATHDHTKSSMPLRPAAIEIGARAWVAADVFITAGIKVGEGAVVGARSSVYKDVPPWVVAAGNPARVIKARAYEDDLD